MQTYLIQIIPDILSSLICAIGNKYFEKDLNFIVDTMIWYLNPMLDFNLSCARDFRSQNFMPTYCIN